MATVRLHLGVVVAAGAAVLALGGTSVAIAREAPLYTFAGTTAGAVALVGAAWVLAAAGVLSWFGRRADRFGPLLVLTAATWLLSEWDNPGSGRSVVFTVGLLLGSVPTALIALVTLVDATGRLRSGTGRVLAAASGVASVGVLGVARTLFYDPAAELCTRCPANLAVVSPDRARADDLAALGFRLTGALAIATALLALVRLARSSPTRRRAAAATTLACVAYLGAAAWTALASAASGYVGGGDTAQRLWFAQAAALGALAAAVVWGRLRVRRTRAAMARLGVELSASAGGRVRDLLARTLDDPDLVVTYSVGGGDPVDGAGRAVARPPGTAATTIVGDGRPVATLFHRPGLLDDPELLDEVAAATRLALDNERLRAELRVKEAQLRRSRARVVEVGDAERRRLERDLHDGAQQRLMGVLLATRLARTHPDIDDAGRDLLDTAAAELLGAIEALRDIAHRLHPAALSDDGLAGALEALAERGPWPVRFHDIPCERLPPEVEHVAYRAVADTARLGRVDVRAATRAGRFVLDIDAATAPAALVELEDRVAAARGTISVSSPNGTACRIHVELPVETHIEPAVEGVAPCG